MKRRAFLGLALRAMAALPLLRAQGVAEVVDPYGCVDGSLSVTGWLDIDRWEVVNKVVEAGNEPGAIVWRITPP